MKLYTHALSPFSAKVRIALDEKGVACDEISLPISRTAILEKPAELLAINPRGQVPALLDGELALFDSTVIVEYLEERHPAPPLFPRGVAARARARLLEEYGDGLMNGCIADLLAETYRKPDRASWDAARIAEIGVAIRAAFDRLEAALGGRDHLCGEFGAADVACYLPVRFAAFFGVPPGDEHPRLRAWLERCAARPSIAREFASMSEALKKL